MSLLSDLSITDGEAAFRAASRRVADRLDELPAPRSLCELRLEDDDVAWLRAWARSLSPSWLRITLGGLGRTEPVHAESRLRRVEALGCLLLLVATEAARRDAREGAVWPTVQDCFAP